jgi:hypothetical protein
MIERLFFKKVIRYGILVVLIATGSLFAEEKCELIINGCPDEINGDTIVVPDKVVKLSSVVRACKASQSIQAGAGENLSIMFVIDNSGSMIGDNGNDPDGSRFFVTKALIDTINKNQPNAEVGLIIFREHLFFDTASTEYYSNYFKTFSSVVDLEPNQAYLPFMKLNQVYGSKTGLNIINDILTPNASKNNILYQPSYRSLRPLALHGSNSETNINGALEAVKQAFASAQNPKERQFVIFLSDGEPTGNAQAGYPKDYFRTETGTVNVPTTFTVYFTDQTQPPGSLNDMTNNIKINGYSATNPKSNIWPLLTSYDALMGLLMQNVMPAILLSGNPIKMTINNTATSNSYLDSMFFFTESFPITNQLTQFSLGITYRYVNPQTSVLKDTVVYVSFYVKKNGINAPPLPSGLTMKCQNILDLSGIPVTATLLDTNHEGHLDRIDILWADTAKIKQSMPAINEFITRLELTSNSGKTINLTAYDLQPDLANKTIHVLLTENTGDALETGWTSATVTISNVPMSISGKPFVLTNIIDGAAPVIKSVCFVPTSNADTLNVTFSEPVINQSPAFSPENVFTLYTKSGSYKFTKSDPVITLNNDVVTYTFKSKKLSNQDSLVEANRPAFHLSLCGGISIIVDSRVIGNPFIPGKTWIPPSQRGTKNPVLFGTRIEVSLSSAITASLKNGKVRGWVTIFDAVGNTVADKVEMETDFANVKLFMVWDGQTRNRSKAAPGTYRARVLIEDLENGTKESVPMNIGIKQ